MHYSSELDTAKDRCSRQGVLLEMLGDSSVLCCWGTFFRLRRFWFAR